MASIPPDALPILSLFAPAFSQSVFPRAQLLAVACILGTGRRTVSNLLRLLGWLSHGAASSYHKALSQAHWSGLRLAALLTRFLLAHLLPSGPVPSRRRRHDRRAPGQEGVRQGPPQRPGPGQSQLHHLPVGHKWVVLAVLVRFGFATPPWALPVLVALYRSPKENKRHGRAHKTPAHSKLPGPVRDALLYALTPAARHLTNY